VSPVTVHVVGTVVVASDTLSIQIAWLSDTVLCASSVKYSCAEPLVVGVNSNENDVHCPVVNTNVCVTRVPLGSCT
jgi:hypothetical protein